jgi:hypothetical protein
MSACRWSAPSGDQARGAGDIQLEDADAVDVRDKADQAVGRRGRRTGEGGGGGVGTAGPVAFTLHALAPVGYEAGVVAVAFTPI